MDWNFPAIIPSASDMCVKYCKMGFTRRRKLSHETSCANHHWLDLFERRLTKAWSLPGERKFFASLFHPVKSDVGSELLVQYRSEMAYGIKGATALT